MAYRFRRGLGSIPSPPASVASALQAASASSGVPYSILQALAYQESSYNPTAVSSAGAQGLLQVMPANDASLGLTSPFDPNANAAAGAQYLKSLYDQYGDWNTALIAYNEGPGNLQNQGVFSSSQTYADTILANAGVDSSGGSSVDSSGDTSGDIPTDSSTGSSSSLFSSPLVLAGLALGVFGLVALAA